MPTFEFTSPDGKTYEVNGPDGSTKEQAFAHLQGQIGSAPQEKPSSIADAIRSIPGGLAQGVAGLAGLPGDITHLANVGLDKLTGAHVADMKIPGQFTSEDANQAISKPFGGYYQPQTTTGRYAEKAASFAPALVGGEASLGSKLLGRVLAPAAGAQLAGSAVSAENHPILHGAAEVGGALLGGGLASGARALGGALTADAAPEVTANKYLATLLKNQGVGADDIVAKGIGGKGQLGAEALGPSGVATLAALGRRSGTTGEALGNALTTRSLGAPSRIMDDFATASGIHPEAAQGNIDALVDAGRAQAAPLYEKALSGTTGVSTPYLEALRDRPIIKKAMAQAAVDVRNAGRDPSQIGLHFDELGNATARSDPTPEAWDLTKKALGQSVERDAFGNRIPDSKSPGNYNISGANKAISSALSDALPGYGDALKQSGDYLSLKSAFDAGQKHILDTGTTAKQVADHVSNLTPAELDAYKGGMANRVFNQAQNARLAPRILNTPIVQSKLTAALGPDQTSNFTKALQQEIELSKSGSRMMPGTGSITSDIGLMTGEQDNAANLAAGMHGARALGHAVQGNAFGAVGSGLAALRHFAPDLLKTGGMNADVRNELGKFLMRSPEDLAGHVRDLPNLIPQKKSLGQLLMGGSK